jgi:outer membrane autotransporter protein
MLDGPTSDDLGASSGEGEVDSFRVAAYGTWGCSTGLYSDFLLGYGAHDLDRNRLGGLNCVGRTTTEADSFQALGTIGYNFGDECLRHGPFAGLEYQNVDVDAITSFPVSVSGYDVDSFRGLIGYRVNANLGTFRPYASVAYAHEFEDDRISTTATFGSAPFTVTGSERGSAVLVTAGTGIGLTDSLTLDVGYRGDISVDNEGLTSHGGSIGLNYNF